MWEMGRGYNLPMIWWHKVTGPDVAVQSIEPTDLPAHWTSDESVTRPLGASWLEGMGSALLLVPSAIAPETWNALLNPRRPEAAEFRIERVYEYPFDLRLKH
jgi:RES domain-containing protein